VRAVKPRNFVHALLVTALVLGMLACWFLAADRSRIFLYGHLGAQPFDTVTTSRYWMSGLVVTGFLVPTYALLAVVARLRHRDWLPDPLMTTYYSALPLAAGVILIASIWGRPAIAYTTSALLWLALISGIYLALWFAQQIRYAGRHVVLLILDGCAIIPELLLFHALELPGRGLQVSAEVLVLSAVSSVLFGLLWLMAMTYVYRRMHQPSGTTGNIICAGLTGFVLLTTLHYLLATPPGYKYISTGGNFFAGNILLQLATWAVAWLMVLVATRFRRWFT
jgi:hypothetical protein